MKILHLLSGGGIGGIEILCRDIARFGCEEHEFCFLYTGGEIADKMEREQFQIHRMYEKAALKRALSLIKLVKRKKYDVVIVHHEGAGIYTFYLMLIFLFHKVRFIKYLHCSFEWDYMHGKTEKKRKINYKMLGCTLKYSDQAVAVSEFVKESYSREFGCDPTRIEVIYNGIQIPENGRYFLNTGKLKKILYVGRLVEVKGVRVLLYALKNLLRDGEEAELDILGDGAQKEEFIQLANELGIGKYVHFRGKILEKQRYFDEADIFVYPPIWEEAFGISVVEAMAQRKLCIASRSGGIPEIISDQKDGLLFEKGNIKDLTRVLKKAIHLCGTSEYERMTETGRKKAEQFDINSMVRQLENLCRNEK